MRDKKTITVWQNGKQAKVKRLIDDDIKGDSNEKLTFLARIFNNKKKESNLNGKKVNVKEYKPVIIAFFSAIIIGLLLGLAMLNMMTNIKSSSPINEDVNMQAATDNISASSTSIQVILDGMSAFVIQAGLFTQKSNALEWSAMFAEAGLPVVVWKREKQYFLLVGLTNTIEEATLLLNELKQDEFDVFTKEWSTNAIKLDVTAEEEAWLESFQAQWQESLAAINSETDFSINSWDQLMNNHPFEKERISGLVNIMKPYFEVDDKVEVNEQEAQMLLLTMWAKYEEIFK